MKLTARGKIICLVAIALLALSMTACREKKSDKTVLRLMNSPAELETWPYRSHTVAQYPLRTH